MIHYSRGSIVFLFSQLILLLVFRPDHSLSFKSGGLPIADNIRRNHVVESSGTFSRPIGLKYTSKSVGRVSEGTALIPRMKSRSNFRLNAIDIVGVSPEPIHSAFAFATFGPQPFWLLMILLPGQEITKKTMGTMDVVIFFALVHFFIVSVSIVQPGATAPLLEFNDVFDPAKDSQAAFMNMVTNYPNFVAEEWPHVLTW
eukprot:CAMPEP_0197175362 /NCGR_PEP_ID=MMETSP1423-20130617/1596_1 /TAXON_ID=476441 /ORGANISM="Pseudo-nitzschia heimii, Strain UNC1101" /LENGTH=199 /DNA_ID=CAMNT_0042624495 /DNA_START=18 /DNA_END=614 /DNA_ORIENTATION=-